MINSEWSLPEVGDHYFSMYTHSSLLSSFEGQKRIKITSFSIKGQKWKVVLYLTHVLQSQIACILRSCKTCVKCVGRLRKTCVKHVLQKCLTKSFERCLTTSLDTVMSYTKPWYMSDTWSQKIASGRRFWNVTSDAWFWNIAPDVWLKTLHLTPARCQPDARQTQLFEIRRQVPARHQPDANQTPARLNVLKSGV